MKPSADTGKLLVLPLLGALTLGSCHGQVAVKGQGEQQSPPAASRTSPAKQGTTETHPWGIRLSNATRAPEAHRSESTLLVLSDQEASRVLAGLPELQGQEPVPFALPASTMAPPSGARLVTMPLPAPARSGATVRPNASSAVTLVSHGPVGEVWIAPFVSASFSEPMVGLGTLAELAQSRPPIRISPQPAGRWRWLGTQTAVFQPQERFPMATRFSVSVAPGAAAPSGARVQAPAAWEFSTPPPTVVDWYPSAGSTEVALDPKLFVRFDQDVDAKAMLRFVSLRAGGTQRTVRLRTTAEELADRRQREAEEPQPAGRGVPEIAESAAKQWLGLRVTEPLPKDVEVELRIEPGAPSAEGPRRTADAQKLAFRTRGPFRLTDTPCGPGQPCEPKTSLSFQFNHALETDFDQDEVDGRLIRVEPAVADLIVTSFATGQGATLVLQGGFRAGKSYTVTFDGALKDEFGQTLDAPVRHTVTLGDAKPRIDIEGGQTLVLDPALPPNMLFRSINQPEITVRIYRVSVGDWPRYLELKQARQEAGKDPLTVPGELLATEVIHPVGDSDDLITTQLPLDRYLTDGLGHLIVSLRGSNGSARWRLPGAASLGVDSGQRDHALIWVQGTRLGIHTFSEPQAVQVWTTNLADGAAAPGARVSFLGAPGGSVTAADGLGRLRLPARQHPAMVAKKGRDVALLPTLGRLVQYVPTTQIRWFVVDDGGIYRPGDTVHVKGWIRAQGPEAHADLEHLPAKYGRTVSYFLSSESFADSLRPAGSHERTRLARHGEFDFSVTLPSNVPAGSLSISMTLPGADPKLRGATHRHGIKIAEYERPEYEVEVETGAGPYLVGASSVATVRASYFGGGPLPNADTVWRVTAQPATYSPPGLDEYHFGPSELDFAMEARKPIQWKGRTNQDGTHHLRLDFGSTEPTTPKRVELEAAVSDVDQRQFAAKGRLLVHPASVTVGLKSNGFVKPGDDILADLVVTDLDGHPVSGREVTVRSRRYDMFDPFKGKELTDTCSFRSHGGPHTCRLKTGKPGRHTLEASVVDSSGRKSSSYSSVLVLGGSAPLERDSGHEAQVAFEKPEYCAGEDAQLVLVSPFAPAEGTLAVYRGSVAEIRRFRVEKQTSTIPIEIAPEYLPSVYVYVELAGKTTRRRPDGTLDPALPPVATFAHGMTRLRVSSAHRRLGVAVSAPARAQTPGSSVPLEVAVTDPDGKPSKNARVALMVVDEAVLALLDSKPPDPLESLYVDPGASPQTAFRSAQWLPEWEHAAAREAKAKAEQEAERRRWHLAGKRSTARRPSSGKVESCSADTEMPNAVRTDLRTLAAFVSEAETDADGRAHVTVRLPESVTRYRVMATASSTARHFGYGVGTITTQLSLVVRPAAPRFLNHGDRFELAVVVQNPTGTDATVRLAARAGNAEIVGPRGFGFTVPARNRIEVRFNAATRLPGTAVFQVAAASNLGADATRVEVPVWTPAATESFAHYGELTEGSAALRLRIPSAVIPEYGGLELATSATALFGLEEMVHALLEDDTPSVECLASRTLTLAGLRKLWPRFNQSKLGAASRPQSLLARDIGKLDEQRQMGGGQWSYWGPGRATAPGNSWIGILATHALVVARQQGQSVREESFKRALAGLGRINPPADSREARWTILAYSSYVQHLAGSPKALGRAELLLSEAGSVEALPTEAIAWLLPVLHAEPASGSVVDRMHRALDNRVTETAEQAHFVTSYGDQGHVLLHSERRADAVALLALMTTRPNHPLASKLARGLMQRRVSARWQGRQENALALLALGKFIEQHEGVAPNFLARGWLDGKLASEHAFRTRKEQRHDVEVPMRYLLGLGKQDADLVVGKQGAGRLYYRVGLDYAPQEQLARAAEQGFTVMRTYEAVDDPKDVARLRDGSWHVKRGARIKVRTYLRAPALRHYVALTDPLPAGFEALDTSLAVTPALPNEDYAEQGEEDDRGRALSLAEKARYAELRKMRKAASHHWYDRHSLHDDRVQAFAARLPAGVYVLEYFARSLTPGTFIAPPPVAEQMHAPETFGRDGAAMVVVEQDVRSQAFP